MAISKTLMKAFQWLGVLAVVGFVMITLRAGYFSSVTRMQAFVVQSGWLGPLLFMAIQITQIIIPIIPGGLTTVAGVAIFGPVWGFILNYLSIVAGSILAFQLVRRYGRGFVKVVVPQKYLDKYSHYLNGGQAYDRFFALAILLPVAPDDVLCMLSGLTKMSFKKFMWIIVLCKPWTILVYSMGMNAVITTLAHWL